VRRTLAEVNTVLTGVTFVASFARFKASMAVFSEERTSFCPWVSVAIARTQDNCKKVVQRARRWEESGP